MLARRKCSATVASAESKVTCLARTRLSSFCIDDGYRPGRKSGAKKNLDVKGQAAVHSRGGPDSPRLSSETRLATARFLAELLLSAIGSATKSRHHADGLWKGATPQCASALAALGARFDPIRWVGYTCFRDSRPPQHHRCPASRPRRRRDQPKLTAAGGRTESG
ncbi:hypothetical protein CSUI_010646, partial [Cystoisospora suis]